MARIAMAKNRCSSGVVALLAALFALAGAVGGASFVTDVADTDVPMLTLHHKVYNNSQAQAHNHRARKLATALVWCVAKSNLTDSALQGSLDWVCGPMSTQGQVNCGPLQSGQNCFLPDSASNHASWAFNVYFQTHNATNDACDFQGTAVQVYTDPSTSTCVFQGSTKEINGTIVSSGTVAPPPPAAYPRVSACFMSCEPQFLIHVSAAALVMLMTYLLT